MTRAAAFLVLIPLAGSAVGQKLTADEQAAALSGVREYVRSYTASLPNYTCIQTTRQTMMAPLAAPTGVRLGPPPHTDVFEEQISFVDGREIRTVTKINDQRPLASEQAQIGPVSHGEFGSLLYRIFDPQSGTDIRWKRAATLDGRRVNVFEFRVPQSSGYALVGSKGQVKVPFEGLVYADRQTDAVIQIELKCTGIPSGSEYRALSLTLDYKPARIAGREHLLPSGFLLHYQTTGNAAMIGAEFKSCRQFSADSTVRFDDNPGATGVTRAADVEPVPGRQTIDPEPAPVVTGISKTPPELPPAPLSPAPAPTPVADAQAPVPDQPAAAPPPAPDSAVFRASTRLVQVNVIAQDKDGKPVTDLRRDEFQIFDNAAPQEIRLFLADVSEPSAAAARAQGTFTNRIGSGGSSVILFDKLSGGAGGNVFTHNARAREKAIEAVKAIPPGERIAVYSLWCRFLVVREFTSDRDSLLEKLDAFHPGFGACVDATTAATDSRSADPQQSDVVAAMKSREQQNFNSIAFRLNAELGEYEFRMMADHLAGIPGRKNLIWVTSQFNLSAANLKKLVDANVAIYPVDALGSFIGLASGKKERYDHLRAFAAVSGGAAFYDRDDLDAGIRDAMRDGLISYTLGFYPASEDTKAPLHRLGVRVSRPGVTLRYRTSYELEPPPPPSGSPVADLVQALNRPVDATVIPITANATRNGGRVDVSVSIDVPSLDLELSDGLWKGKAELVMRFVTADGLPAGDASAQTLTFGFRPATWESMLKGGDPYRSHDELPIPPKATELKVLVGNLASGKIGTLTIPLSALAPSPSNPPPLNPGGEALATLPARQASTSTSLGAPAPDSAEALRRVRENVRAYLDQLPRITCTERTRQTIRIAGAEGSETREDSCDTHQYKLYSVQTLGLLGGNLPRGKSDEPNKKPTAPDWREQLKDASLGATTAFLAALVDPRADAGLRWVRAGRANGRAVSLYAFQVAMPQGFLLTDATGSIRVPFKGLLYADAATGALVWMEIQCIGIPRESEYIGAEVTVHFGSFDVAGRELNLPVRGRVRFRLKQGDTTNEAEYSAYRIAEFGANSNIKFEDEVEGNSDEAR
jgi:VWFA-related protein